VKKISILLLTIFLVLSCTDNKKANVQHKSKVTLEKKNKSDIVWYSNIEEAVNIAKQKNKPILLQFSGSDWCKWCIRLNNEVLHTKEFSNYAKDNLILVNLDYPRSIPQTEQTKAYNQEMLQKYGIRGFPTVLLLDKNGNVLHQTGYRPGGPIEYIKHIKQVLEN